MKFSDWIIHHDHHILLVNKPAGIPVQKDLTGDDSLWEKSQRYAKAKLHLHNRLDRPVSGLVLFTKSEKATANIEQQQHKSEILKKYWAVVTKKENLDDTGELVHFHTKLGNTQKAICELTSFENANQIKLNYKKIADSDNYVVLEVSLNKGRFHQIRAQLATEKMYIKGDVKYGARRKNRDRSIHLHAASLDFVHPSLNQKVHFSCLPDESDSLWKFVIENQSNK